VTALFTWLWQGLALAGAATLLLRSATRLNAATRHAIWWGTMWTVILLPHVSPMLAVGWKGAVLPVSPEDALLLPAVPGWILTVALILWACRAARRLLRVAQGAILVRRLKERSRPFPADLEARLRFWAAIRSSGRRPILRVSATGGACALGLGRPVILVPQALISKLSDEELDQIVIHEHAHLARYDDWGRLVQALLEALLDLHPAVCYIARQIDLEREAACDDHVVACTGRTRELAECLVEAAAAAPVPFARLMIPGATSGTGDLRRRVGRLLEQRRNHEPNVLPLVSGAAILVLSVTVCVFGRLPPLIGFLEPDHSGFSVRPIATRPLPPSASALTPPRAIIAPVHRVVGPSTSHALRATPNRVVQNHTAANGAGPNEAVSNPLESTPIEMGLDSADAIPPLGLPLHLVAQGATEGSSTPGDLQRPTPESGSEPPPWVKLADAGTALGADAQNAGVSLARYLTNRVKGIAGKF
jgi:beta-lactamase regulating signal transducer with metallopeptidase domain